jgi:uncharacterized repeat protein (TIGR01451 family)
VATLALVTALLGGLLLVAGPASAHNPPDLEVKKTASPASIDAGAFATFIITVDNDGTGDANDVVLMDVLPDSGLDWFEAPDTAACTITQDPGGDILRCEVGTLAPGAFFLVRVKALTDTEDCGILRNVATATSSNEPVELLGNNSAEATIEVKCPPPPPPADEGCTPGFWRNHTSLWDGAGGDDVTTTVQTTDGFNATFGVTSAQSGLANTVTLLGAVNLEGGGRIALARHAAAAAASADAGIAYPYSLAQVIALYQDAVGAIAGPETVASAKAKFEAANQLGCPF